MKNRLQHESSPYLKQHEDNPVDWYPWGEEALRRAREEDKPILLSIGYSACHWCHVMAHESFEDAETAVLMNERYVSVKVDREEMPDLDAIYQQALQLQGEHGGWPLTMFLLPDGRPFFGGTYFPKRDGFGRPSFRRVLVALSEAYRGDRTAVEGNAGQFKEGLAKVASWGRGDASLGVDTVDRAAAKLALRIDRREGGFEGAPKFPNPKAMELLLRAWRRARRRGEADAPELLQLVTRTLLKMAQGGICDQLGGGFHRYSTDAEWLVPHFEKMLYDNAQLLRLYAEVWQVTREPLLVQVAQGIIRWIDHEMHASSGGLYTAQDADSEGVEGKYFVWTPEEIEAVVGREAAEVFCRVYDVHAGGNWNDPHGHGPRGASILHVVGSPQSDDEERLIADARTKLLAARRRRVAPGTDDKQLASLNGLAIGGLAEAARIFGDEAGVARARTIAEFVLGRMVDPAGRLFRAYKDGVARLPGTLDDHAYVADGLIALYEASGEARWLDEAHRLTALSLDLFWDEHARVFYLTAASDPGLIERPVSNHDGAVPSGMSVSVGNLVRLGDVCGERRWLEIAEAALRTYHDAALSNPFGFANLLCTLDLLQERPAEIVLAGEAAPLERALASSYLPNRVIVHASSAPPRLAPLVAGKGPVDGHAAAYVCRDFACRRPETDPAELARTLAP
jgi:uncharacterized protein YyaL (SSP411 family)